MQQRHAVIAPAPSSYPDVEQLQTVYGTYLKPVLHLTLASHPVWGSTAKVHALAGSMVQVYEQVSVRALPTRSCTRRAIECQSWLPCMCLLQQFCPILRGTVTELQ